MGVEAAGRAKNSVLLCMIASDVHDQRLILQKRTGKYRLLPSLQSKVYFTLTMAHK